MKRVIEVVLWVGRKWRQRFPTPRMGRIMEGHSSPGNYFFEDGVMVVGLVRICCSYQGGDHVWEHQCTADVSMRSNWSGDLSGIPLVGCSRNRINIEKQRRDNINSFGLNSAH